MQNFQITWIGHSKFWWDYILIKKQMIYKPFPPSVLCHLFHHFPVSQSTWETNLECLLFLFLFLLRGSLFFFFFFFFFLFVNHAVLLRQVYLWEYWCTTASVIFLYKGVRQTKPLKNWVFLFVCLPFFWGQLQRRWEYWCEEIVVNKLPYLKKKTEFLSWLSRNESD